MQSTRKFVNAAAVVVVVLTSVLLIPGSEGRGRLDEPPSRSSMWRFGFSTPINYNDNGLNCGGIVRQWSVNQGRCGVCGDPYDGSRDNERGGKYVTDTIARSYTQGQLIDVTIFVTSNERGWFEFNLCPSGDVTKPVTEKCLQMYLLSLEDGQTRYYLSPTTTGAVRVRVKLPSGVTCDRCVFRWKWNAGNTWGRDIDNKTCLGCGIQEQFYGCSDVSIRRSSDEGGPVVVQTSMQPPPPSPSPTTPTSQHNIIMSTMTTATTKRQTDVIVTDDTVPPQTSTTTTQMPVTTSSPVKVTKAKATTLPKTTRPMATLLTMSTKSKTAPTTQEPASSSKVRCKAVNDWLGIDAFDQWCEINCNDLNICLSKNCLCNF